MSTKNDIKGIKGVTMTTGESKRTFQLEYTVKTANDEKAGMLPAGTSVDSVSDYAILDSDGTTISGVFDEAPTVSENIVTFILNEPSTGVGHYTVWLETTLDSGEVRIRQLPMEVEA